MSRLADCRTPCYRSRCGTCLASPRFVDLPGGGTGDGSLQRILRIYAFGAAVDRAASEWSSLRPLRNKPGSNEDRINLGCPRRGSGRWGMGDGRNMVTGALFVPCDAKNGALGQIPGIEQ